MTVKGVFKMFKIIILALICAVFISCSFLPKRGNGDLVELGKTFSSFEKINIAAGGKNIEIHYYKSEEFKVDVTIDSNLQDDLNIDVKNDVLNIETKTGRTYWFTKCLVKVYSPAISAVTLAGAGSFRTEDKIIVPEFGITIAGTGKAEGAFECDTFNAQIAGNGNFDGSIVCENISVQIAGTGDITLTGSSNDANISMTGSGKFNGTDFDTNNTSINVSGAGKADIAVSDYLNASVIGAGRINYRGNPKTEFANLGVGRINQL
jgi:hypothetical protein